MKFTVNRLPSALYVIARAIHDPEAAERALEDLRTAGWRLVPGRAPSPRTNENALPVLQEGQLTTRQLIDAANEFDQLDEDLFSAADFVAWLVPDVRGSPEQLWLERRRNAEIR